MHLHPDLLLLFDGYPDALPLYLAVERHILTAYPDTAVKVGKTQVSFTDRYGFAFVSPPLRRMKGWPAVHVILTFGLGHREDHHRIFAASEPYPGRWTHHTVIAEAADLDGQVASWLDQAHAFAQTKRRRKA